MDDVNVLYQNIKKRRKELNMSQQELGELVGYSGKSMISQVEKGMIDLPTTMIKKFAEALNTTPSSLMGWDDFVEDVTQGQVDLDEMSHAIEMYELYKKSSPKVQSMVEYLLDEGNSSGANPQG